MNDDYSDLRAGFQKIDQSNPKALRKWFEEYAYLNIQDLSIIIGKCSRDVRALRRSVGIQGKAPKTKNRATTRTVDIAELPDNWRTREWLIEHLPKYGSNSIIRATGLTKKRFYEILRKLEVPLPGRINKNPCYTKAWCHRHYVELGYSIRKCAKIAGVTHPTFVDWLIKFKIQIRVHQEPYQVPIELKHLIVKLREHPIVRRVKTYPTHLYVKYRDGLYGRYIYKTIPGDEWVLNSIPKITNEYENDLTTGTTYPAHITIANLDQCSVFERDVVLHEFVKQLATRGWIWPSVPQEVLLRELDVLKNVKESNYIKNGAFTSIFSRTVTKYIMLHYFEHGYIWEYFRRPRRMWKLAKQLLKTKSKFNVYNLIRLITKERSRFRFPNPAFYSIILRRLGFTGTVLDLQLGTGARAVACGLAGCDYGIHDNPRFRQAIERGFADLMDLKYQYYDGSEVVDLVINDNDLSETDIEYALSFADRAKNIMVYVPREKKLEYQKMYKPKSMIKVVTHPMNRDPNYFFIW